MATTLRIRTSNVPPDPARNLLPGVRAQATVDGRSRSRLVPGDTGEYYHEKAACALIDRLFPEHELMDLVVQGAHGGKTGGWIYIATLEEVDEPIGETIRAKWLMDGATTLEEAAQRLENEAKRLRGLQAAGWRLLDPVKDDYGFLVEGGK
jgi:hypothetical protein